MTDREEQKSGRAEKPKIGRLCGALILCLAAVALSGLISSASADPTLDELLNLAPPTAEPAPAEPAQVPVDPEVARRLAGQEAADALEQAIAEMQTVSDRLGRDLDSGLVTQREQEEILAKLDRVIAAAKQMQQQGSPSSSGGSSGDSSQGQPQGQQSGSAGNAGQQAGQGNQGNQPSQGASEGSGQGNQAGDQGGGARDPQDGSPNAPLEEQRSEWGNLPPRLRDQLLEGTREKFSPVYRGLTEAYYKRLAEEGK